MSENKNISKDLKKPNNISDNIMNKKGKKNKPKIDWWRLCRDFCNVYIFFSIGRKYSGFAKVRNNMINERNLNMLQDVAILKEWVISITQGFW